MATIDMGERSRILTVAAVMLAIVGLMSFLYFYRLPPQIGVDDDVFRTVDALFTAINSHDKLRLDDCERRLKSCRDKGTLPPAAASFLDSIIEQARSNQWGPSAHRLYDFMRGQRRS